MIWTLRVTFILFLAWVIFMISPFVALYDLAKAVEARDTARISERVNFRALRTSLSRQIVGEYLKTPNGAQEFSGLDRQMAMNAGSAVLNPLVEQLVTPEALLDLLEDGWPQQAAGDATGSPATPIRFDLGSIGQAWRLFITSETQGFRSITIPYPNSVPKERQFRLTLRLSGTTWRLTGVELPQALRENLAKRAVRKTE
jgi:hypothetical protein